MTLNLSNEEKEILKVAISNYPLPTKTEPLRRIIPDPKKLTREIHGMKEKGFISDLWERSTDNTISLFTLNPKCTLFLKGDYSEETDNIKNVNDFFRKEFDKTCNRYIEKVQQRSIDLNKSKERYTKYIGIFLILVLIWFLIIAGTDYNKLMVSAIFLILLILNGRSIYIEEKKIDDLLATTKEKLVLYLYGAAHNIDQFIKNRTYENIISAKEFITGLGRSSEGYTAQQLTHPRRFFSQLVVQSELFTNRGFSCDLKIIELSTLLQVASKEYFKPKLDSHVKAEVLTPLSYQLKKIAKYFEDENFEGGITFFKKDLGIKTEKEKRTDKIKELLNRSSLLKVALTLVIVVVLDTLLIYLLLKLGVDPSVKIGILDAIGIAIVIITAIIAEIKFFHTIIHTQIIPKYIKT